MTLKNFEKNINKTIEALEDCAVMALDFRHMTNEQIEACRDALLIIADIAANKARYCDMALMAREEAKKELEATN